jgi:hypothetical protein
MLRDFEPRIGKTKHGIWLMAPSTIHSGGESRSGYIHCGNSLEYSQNTGNQTGSQKGKNALATWLHVQQAERRQPKANSAAPLLAAGGEQPNFLNFDSDRHPFVAANRYSTDSNQIAVPLRRDDLCPAFDARTGDHNANAI